LYHKHRYIVSLIACWDDIDFIQEGNELILGELIIYVLEHNFSILILVTKLLNARPSISFYFHIYLEILYGKTQRQTFYDKIERHVTL